VRLLLRLISLFVPRDARARWVEEWRAELRHGRWTMVFGALPDAWALRRLSLLPPKGGSHMTSQAGAAPLPPLGGRKHGGPFHAFPQDVRYAVRGLFAARLFTLSVVASLGVGIASTSAAFGFLHTLMFRGIPGAAEEDRLVRLTINRGCGWPGCWIDSSTPEDYEVLRGALPSLDAVSAEASAQVAVRIGTEAHSLGATIVSANYFDVLGVRPAIGRGFRVEEQQLAYANVAVIGYTLWQRLFAEDPAVLGQFVDVAGQTVRIVGVAPPKFGGGAKGNMRPGGGTGAEIWLPMALASRLLPIAEGPMGRTLPRTEYDFRYVGRLKSETSIEHAHSDAAVAGTRIAGARGAAGADSFVQVRHVLRMDRSEANRLLTNLMVVPMLVLAIACLNAANLLLARGSERARDIAVRLALGASRWRVVRQILTESLLLALMAGALSIPLIQWLLSIGEAATGMPLSLSAPALLFTMTASLLCAFGFGLAPAVRAAQASAGLGSSRPGDHGPGRMRARRAMVAVQVALSIGLLATGGQVIGAMKSLFERTGAADPEHLVLASFDLDQLKFTRPAAGEFYSRLLDEVRRMPGVENAALSRRGALWTWGRGIGSSSIVAWGPDDEPKDGTLYLGGYAGGDLTGTVGLRLVAGRGFRPEDATPQPSAAIVSRAFAEAKLKRGAIGRRIRVATRTQRHTDSVEVTVVGVVEAAEDLSYTKREMRSVYVASPLQAEPALTLYVRSRGGIQQLGPAVRAAARTIDPRVPIVEIETLAALTERRHFEERIMAGGLTLFGTIALLLATAGLYALVSFMVTLRRRELGVRIALGAAPGDILRLVLRQSLRLALAGSLFGGVVALVLGALVHASMLGTPGVDVTLFVAAAAILGCAMLLASAIPARRAARVDPLTVLRQE
jgi:predicted permease